MHFYTEKDGKIHPRHFVPMAKDPSRTRASRVTDAKKAKKEGETWLPSVTTVLNILDKPGLNNWRVDQHLSVAHEFYRDGIVKSEDDYLHAIKGLTRERLDAAPKAGTDIHKVLEDFIGKGIAPDNDIELKICHNVQDALIKHCDSTKGFECEKYFLDTDYGYAGCADLVRDDWVIDYKSKQEASKFKPGKMAYPEHQRQLAAYDYGLGDPKRCANIFICLETGEIDFHEHTKESLEKGWKIFKHCLEIYKLETYNPLGE